MIIGHSIPSATWTLSGTGAAFLSPVQLGSRPDRVTAIRWLSGTQTTSSVLRLRGEWTTPIVPGLLYLAGGDLPAGTKIDVAWRRASDPAGTYPYQPAAHNSPQRVVAGPRGERTCAILLQPGATAVVGVEVRIYNDVAGVPAIPASATITLGAVIPCATTELPLAPGVEIDPIDPTATTTSGTRAMYAVPGIPYRQLTCSLQTADQAAWFSAYAPLLARIDRGRPAVYVPRYKVPSGAFDAGLLHAYAMIGAATKLPQMQHLARPYFGSGQFTVDEWPVPV